jgi:Protein of unknown function (DUF3105)
MTPVPRRWLWRLGTVAVLAVILVTTFVGQWRQLTATAVGSTAPDRVDACLPGTAVPLMASPHVSQAAIASVRYNSTPPTSGPHFAFVVTPGIYPDPIPDGLAIHAMEHGHVVVHYARTISPADLGELRRFAKRYPRDVVLSPYPGLTDLIAMTAWGRIEKLDRLDESRVVTFTERLRGRYDHGWTHADDCASGGPRPRAAGGFSSRADRYLTCRRLCSAAGQATPASRAAHFIDGGLSGPARPTAGYQVRPDRRRAIKSGPIDGELSSPARPTAGLDSPPSMIAGARTPGAVSLFVGRHDYATD